MMAIIGGTISANLTVSSLSAVAGITGLQDLGGRQVAVVNQSTADIFMTALGSSDVIRYPNKTAMFDDFLLPSRPFAAIVYDTPILIYFANTAGAGMCAVVGNSFQPQDYGIAFPFNSPYLINVSVALLAIQEGTDSTGETPYQQLYDKYFLQSASTASGDATSSLQADKTLLGITYGVAGFMFVIVGIIITLNHWRRKKRRASRPVELSSPGLATSSDSLTNVSRGSSLVSDLQKIKAALSILETRAAAMEEQSNV